MPRTLQPVKSSAVINKRVMSTASHPPLFLVPPTRSPLIQSIRVKSSCKAGIEPKTPVQMAVKRRTVKTSAASTSSADDQQPALWQARSSKFPGEMGEERCIYIVDEIKEVNMMPRSPDSWVVLTPTVPPVPPSPRHPFDESKPSMKMTTGQRAEGVVINKEETHADKNSPEAWQPTHSDTSAPHQSANSSVPLIETLPSQDGRRIVSARHLSRDVRSPTVKTIRKQSDSYKVFTMEYEGIRLERAAAYIRERMSRCTFSCNAFVL